MKQVLQFKDKKGKLSVAGSFVQYHTVGPQLSQDLNPGVGPQTFLSNLSTPVPVGGQVTSTASQGSGCCGNVLSERIKPLVWRSALPHGIALAAPCFKVLGRTGLTLCWNDEAEAQRGVIDC